MLDKNRAVDPKKLRRQLFINGEFVDAEDGATLEVANPHDNSKLVDLAEAKEVDVDKAVAAARAAFPAWRDTNPSDRAQLLHKLADALEARFDEMTELEAIDTGHPLRDTYQLHFWFLAFFQWHAIVIHHDQDTIPFDHRPFLCIVKWHDGNIFHVDVLPDIQFGPV